jgi:uncharacterized protein YjdB
MMPPFLASVLWAVISIGGCSTGLQQPSTLNSITITGTTTLSAVGQTTQLTATATLLGGTSSNVSTQATWQSSNDGVAVISATGLVTASGYGIADISAAYQGMTGGVSVSVTPPPPRP